MTTENVINHINKADEDWLDKMYRQSKSERTRAVAKTSLKCFNWFCQDQGMEIDEDPDVTFGYIPKMVEQFKIWYNPKPNPEILVRPDIDAICRVMDNFVGFMDIDQSHIQIGTHSTFKRKSPKTIGLYFGFIKSYLRYVHGIKLSTEDIKDFVTFPSKIREARKPITLEQLKEIMNNSGAQRRALYYVLVSSGMRLGEALTLTKNNLHMDENPVRISIEAQNTKTNQSRETYISSEAVEKLTPILEKIPDNNTSIFMLPGGNLHHNVINEDRIFSYLREKLGMTEKYPNSVRYVVNLHSLRAYFHTKASQKHSTEYANSMDGHFGYLEQYYRLDPKKRAEMYKELEPELLVESVKTASDKSKDKIISGLTEQMAKMEAKMSRIELLNA